MYKSIVFFSLLSFLLIGCSSEESTEMHSENDEVKIDSSNATQVIDISNSEQLADDLITSRKEYLNANFEEEVTEYGVSIEGQFYYSNGELSIYNFTEYWGNDYIQFSIVTKAVNAIDQFENVDGGKFGNIHEFLKQTFPEDVAFYLGNFEDAPDYQIVDYKSMLLTHSYNRNTYYESTSQLYFATSELESQPVFARTMGKDGECEKFNGYREKFVLGEDQYRIVIEREENIFDHNCELLHSFNYQKIWIEANLLGMSEGGPERNVPTYFAMDFMKSHDFDELPKLFFQLEVKGEDTLYNGGKYQLKETQFGSQKTAFSEESDYFSVATNLVIGCRKEADGSHTLYDRSAGLGSDYYVEYLDGLESAEFNKEFRELNIKNLDSPKGLFLFTYPDTGNEFLFTIQNAVFEEAEIETDL
jgi:uncharacterized protein YcfL